MLEDLKNSKDVLSKVGPIRGERWVSSDKKLFGTKNVVIDTLGQHLTVELHLYTYEGGYIDSVPELDRWTLSVDGTILLDIHKDLELFHSVKDYPYKVNYNFLKHQIGSYWAEDKLFVQSVSSDRTEIKLGLTNTDSSKLKKQMEDFVVGYVLERDTLLPAVLNFGENLILPIINVTTDGSANYFYVKLAEPLPETISDRTLCWVDLEVLQPYIDDVIFKGDVIESKKNTIAGPDFNQNYEHYVSRETQYKSWDDILSTDPKTSQEILDSYISGSLNPVELNIFYGEFSNFVIYSSAEERVKNFFYKVGLVEWYDSQIETLQEVTGSTTGNILNLQNNKKKIVSGFDGFEKYLYYGTTDSFRYTYEVSSSVLPYPKTEVSPTGSYTFESHGKYYNVKSVTDSSSTTWKDDLIDKAIDFDRQNISALIRTVPRQIAEDPDNAPYLLFLNMIGQHFDTIWLYTDHILKKFSNEEHPLDGVSKDLLYNIAKDFGWTLSHGNQMRDLWDFLFGRNEDGTAKWVDGDVETLTPNERTSIIWRRIVNNLPLIYKTKGNYRSISALLSAYGIPSTILTIREYGGVDTADITKVPRAPFERFTYFLNQDGEYVGNSITDKGQYVKLWWGALQQSNRYPDTFTFRFVPNKHPEYSYPHGQNELLFRKGNAANPDFYVSLHRSGSDSSYQNSYGKITFHLSGSSGYKTQSYSDYFFEGVPLYLMLRRSGSYDSASLDNSYDFYVWSEKWGKINICHTGSIFVTGSTPSYNSAWSSTGSLLIGSGSTSESLAAYSGSIFEARYWSEFLSSSAFEGHVLSARSYNGNTPTSSYYNLAGQWRFWRKWDAAVTTSLVTSHPNQTITTFVGGLPLTASVVGYTTASFEGISETYNTEIASLASNVPYAEKVRIDDEMLVGSLNPDGASGQSVFDKFIPDSPRLMVAFSPQEQINQDIYHHIGYTRLDDYIGDPDSVYKDGYPYLGTFNKEYWKKYQNKNDFNAYLKLISIYDLSIFEQIRQILPARANEIVGIVIEPTILERTKFRTMKKPSGVSPDRLVGESNEMIVSKNVSGVVSGPSGSLLMNQTIDGDSVSMDTDINFEARMLGEDSNLGNTDIYITQSQTGGVNKVVGTLIGTKLETIAGISRRSGSVELNVSDQIIGKKSQYSAIVNEKNSILTEAEVKKFDGKLFITDRSSVKAEKGDYDSNIGVLPDFTSCLDISTEATSSVSDGKVYKYVPWYDTEDHANSRIVTEYRTATAQYTNSDNLTRGIKNARHYGCRLSAPAINQTSTELPTISEVVKVTIGQFSQITFTGGTGASGSSQLT